MGIDHSCEWQRSSAEKLTFKSIEDVEYFAGGIAHDFNNWLHVIQGYAYLTQKELPSNSRVQNYMHNINKAVYRATQLSQQLMAFARQRSVASEVISLSELLLELKVITQQLIGERITLVLRIDTNLSCIKMAPGQFDQVFINLAINARDAMPEGGAITIEAANVTLSKRAARLRGDIQPGEYIQFSVSDTGFGIEAGKYKQIFDPFFTTKEQGKGTGLGLATCKKIVDDNGGSIQVSSELGKGTTFQVYLPAVQKLQ